MAARLDRLEEGLAELRILMSHFAPDTGAAAHGLSTAKETMGSGLHTATSLAAMITSREGESSAKMTAVSQPSADMFGVHLASFRTPQQVKQGWQRLSRQHAAALKSLTPVHARVSLADRGVYYRLKAGPLTSWRAAEDVCGTVRSQGQSCSVMDFSGVPLGQPDRSGH